MSLQEDGKIIHYDNTGKSWSVGGVDSDRNRDKLVSKRRGIVRGRSLGGSSGVKEYMRGCAKIGVDSDGNRGYWGVQSGEALMLGR